MNKCPKCGKDFLDQLACTEESCPYDPGNPAGHELVEVPFDDLLEPEESAPENLFAEPVKLPKQIRLSSGKMITLNSQQEEALELIYQWQDDRTDLFFVLSGYAGTGKTTIVKEALRRWANRSPYGSSSTGVTAPTHKAKKVIADATGLQASTIQSLLGLQPNVDLADFNINKPEFAMKKDPQIKHYKMLVLDEGSMLNKDLWKMLKDQANRYNTKLIVMLDEAQLPPVKEEISAVLLDEEIRYKYQLTKVERQAGDNPLMELYDLIRSDIHSKTDKYHKETSTIPAPVTIQNLGIDWLGYIFTPDLMSFGRAVVDSFRSEAFGMDKNHCKVLCWTNQRVQFWNASVRKTLLADLAKKNIPAEQMLHAQTIMPDELLMGYKSYIDGIENSGEYEVIELQYSSKVLTHTSTSKDGQKKTTIEREVRGYRVALQDVDQGTILNAFILDPDSEEEKKFTTIFNSYLFAAKAHKAWPAYFNFKAETLLMRAIRDNTGSLICDKDLDYAYALSVHKSQGSTYDQIFVDEANINLNKIHTERNKLKYVAFSRPRYLATILTGA